MIIVNNEEQTTGNCDDMYLNQTCESDGPWWIFVNFAFVSSNYPYLLHWGIGMKKAMLFTSRIWTLTHGSIFLWLDVGFNPSYQWIIISNFHIHFSFFIDLFVIFLNFFSVLSVVPHFVVIDIFPFWFDFFSIIYIEVF